MLPLKYSLKNVFGCYANSAEDKTTEAKCTGTLYRKVILKMLNQKVTAVFFFINKLRI